MARISRILLLVVLGCSLPAGCGFVQSKKDTEKILHRHFQSISTNGYDFALADYGPRFFSRTSRAEWRNTLEKLTGKLGLYQNHSVRSWRVLKKVGSDGSGTYIEVQCQTSYAKYAAQEKFTFFKGPGDRDYKIIAHTINSDGLLKE